MSSALRMKREHSSPLASSPKDFRSTDMRRSLLIESIVLTHSALENAGGKPMPETHEESTLERPRGPPRSHALSLQVRVDGPRGEQGIGATRLVPRDDAQHGLEHRLVGTGLGSGGRKLAVLPEGSPKGTERDEACLDPEARDLDAERLRQSLQREFAGRIESLIWGGDETLQSADDEDSALARFAHSRKESLYRSQRPEIIDVHHGLGLFEARVLDGSGEARTCAADQGVDPTLRGVYPFRGLDRRS